MIGHLLTIFRQPLIKPVNYMQLYQLKWKSQLSICGERQKNTSNIFLAVLLFLIKFQLQFQILLILFQNSDNTFDFLWHSMI